MKVLIIGGTGLISIATTRSLLESGVEVTHYNRGRSSGEFAGNVQTIRGDRTDHASFERAMAAAGPFDCVNDAAKRDLGFAVTIHWVDGMRRSVKWLDDHGNIPTLETAPWYDRIIEVWDSHGARMTEALKGLGLLRYDNFFF